MTLGTAALFLAYSRVIEVVPVPGLYTGLLAILGLYALASGRFAFALSIKESKLLVALSALMVPASIFGLWPGGSVDLLVNIWSKSLVLFFALLAVGLGRGAVWKLLDAVAYSILAICILSVVYPTDTMGRFAINTATLQNPNDLAAFLAVGIPICAGYAATKAKFLPARLVMAGTAAWAATIVLRTGSRGGLIAVLLTVAIAVWQVKRHRLLLLFAVLGSGLVAISQVPDDVWVRYVTVVSDDVAEVGDSRQVEFATGSTAGRIRLLGVAAELVFYNPVFGVGPGQFGTGNASLTEAGQRDDWHNSHNSYTQVFAECGIPGGVVFLLFVVALFKRLKSLRAQAKTEPALRKYFARIEGLNSGFIGLVCAAMFANIAYLVYFPILASLIVCAHSEASASIAEQQTSNA